VLSNHLSGSNNSNLFLAFYCLLSCIDMISRLSKTQGSCFYTLLQVDADYYLLTDGDASSITDMWRTAPEVQWDQFLAEEATAPRTPQQQPAVVGKSTAVGPTCG
uniref:Uncharacterized protein n=1 Tax=Aegilops tauschii subsp. strangulata TaxID=200361 RepID=A0A453BYE6_AEGTS